MYVAYYPLNVLYLLGGAIFTDLFVYQFSKTKIVIVANLMVALKILPVLYCRLLCDIS